VQGRINSIPGHALGAKIHGGLDQRLLCLAEHDERSAQVSMIPIFFHHIVNQTHKVHKESARSHGNLTTQQIQGLNTSGPFVDSTDLGVPNQNRNAILFTVAVPAVYLQGQTSAIKGHFRGVAFANGSEQVQKIITALPFLFIRGVASDVSPVSAGIEQAPRSLYYGLLSHEHASDVRMLHDSHPLRIGIFEILGPHSLDPFMSIVYRQLICRRGLGHALQAHP